MHRVLGHVLLRRRMPVSAASADPLSNYRNLPICSAVLQPTKSLVEGQVGKIEDNASISLFGACSTGAVPDR